MSDPNEHSRSESEPRDPGGGGDPGGAAGEARRFWDEYARSTRPGRGSDRVGGSDSGNGHGSAPQDAHECLDWCPICRTADVLRASTPPEFRDQLSSLQHDALVTLRGVIDAYLDRSDPPARSGAVENIPID
jgi:hypothetical protein